MRRALGGAVALGAALALSGCADGGFFDRLFRRPTPAATAMPRYLVGPAYRAGGVWRYPREQFEYDETGLATIAAAPAGGLTADGEVFDPTALAAGHRTLQLPAIARVKNVETGREVLVRLNDRGPESPGRLIALTPRAAELLGVGGDGARVRVRIVEDQSRQLAAASGGAGPAIAVATVPVGGVSTETLAPPPGAAASGRVRQATLPAAAAPPRGAPAIAAVPLRLPERVSQGVAEPGALYIDLGAFSQRSAAELLRRRAADLGAEVTTSYAAPRDRAYRVRIGPFGSVAEADAILGRALRAGVADSRIVVE